MRLPPPNRVFIKISEDLRLELFNKKIIRDDGSVSELFIQQEYEKSFDMAWAQNVNVGEVILVGEDVKNILQGDVAIIDYLVDNRNEIIVGYDGQDKIVSVIGVTTYHYKDAKGANKRRLLYRKGDIKELSEIYGVVRNEKLIPIEPFVFLEDKSSLVTKYTESGLVYEEEIKIVERKVLASYEKSYAKENDILVLKESEIFNRKIDDKEISVIFNQDVKCKSM